MSDPFMFYGNSARQMTAVNEGQRKGSRARGRVGSSPTYGVCVPQLAKLIEWRARQPADVTTRSAVEENGQHRDKQARGWPGPAGLPVGKCQDSPTHAHAYACQGTQTHHLPTVYALPAQRLRTAYGTLMHAMTHTYTYTSPAAVPSIPSRRPRAYSQGHEGPAAMQSAIPAAAASRRAVPLKRTS